MTGVRGDLALYRRLVGARVRSQLQYRVSFVIDVIGSFCFTFLDFVTVVVLFEHFPALDGWTLAEVALLYGISGIGIAADMFVGHVEDISAQIRTGDFDVVLLRPAPTLLQGVTAGEARDVIDTARRLEAFAETDEAVRRGELSAKQAKMITEVAVFNPDAEQQLLKAAEQGLVPLKDACVAARAAVEGQAERTARQRSLRTLRTWTDSDGMLAGSFRLTPEVGGAFKARIDGEVRHIFRERRAGTEHEPLDAYAADALAAFALGDGDGEHAPKKGAQYTAHVFIDHTALVRGNTVAGEVCEIPGVGPVNVAWVREILGSAFLTAIVKKGKDIKTVAHLGRHIPAEVRTALLVNDHECGILGCHIHGYLEIDHTHDYAKGGLTTLENLDRYCSIHHDLKTKGWILGPRDPKTGKRTLRPPPGGSRDVDVSSLERGFRLSSGGPSRCLTPSVRWSA